MELLSGEGAFPALRDVVCFRSSAVLELKQASNWYPLEVPQEGKDEGVRVDEELGLALVGRRGMVRVWDSSIDWRKVHFGRGWGG